MNASSSTSNTKYKARVSGIQSYTLAILLPELSLVLTTLFATLFLPVCKSNPSNKFESAALADIPKNLPSDSDSV